MLAINEWKARGFEEVSLSPGSRVLMKENPQHPLRYLYASDGDSENTLPKYGGSTLITYYDHGHNEGDDPTYAIKVIAVGNGGKKDREALDAVLRFMDAALL